METSETTPLLPSDRNRQQVLRARIRTHVSAVASLPEPATSASSVSSTTSTDKSLSIKVNRVLVHARLRTHGFLTSRVGHYSVLALVSLDVACIFADFLISLYTCEHFCSLPPSLSIDDSRQTWEKAQAILANISIAFSCLFLLELLSSIWAFGREFFRSKFHVFDAAVILFGFVLDVCLKGVVEEVGSIVVVLRFWRVFKILEELGDAATEQMEGVGERLEVLERENAQLQMEVRELRRGKTQTLAGRSEEDVRNEL